LLSYKDREKIFLFTVADFTVLPTQGSLDHGFNGVGSIGRPLLFPHRLLDARPRIDVL
jgi:hypothetical protein